MTRENLRVQRHKGRKRAPEKEGWTVRRRPITGYDRTAIHTIALLPRSLCPHGTLPASIWGEASRQERRRRKLLGKLVVKEACEDVVRRTRHGEQRNKNEQRRTDALLACGHLVWVRIVHHDVMAMTRVADVSNVRGDEDTGGFCGVAEVVRAVEGLRREST